MANDILAHDAAETRGGHTCRGGTDTWIRDVGRGAETHAMPTVAVWERETELPRAQREAMMVFVCLCVCAVRVCSM